MIKHFRVQSVLLTHNQVAVTLTPVEWIRPRGDETDEEGYPSAWDDCEPSDAGAQPYEPGGNKTELRFNRFSSSVDQTFLPDEFVTLTVERTEHNWSPGE